MKKLFSTTSLLAFALAFDGGITPGWKKDENGNLVLKDGNPINVLPNGQEQTVGLDTITRLNAEAKEHRVAKEAAEESLKKFTGISDPDAAKKALEIVAKLDQKKLIDAGEVDKVKDEMRKEFTGQIDTLKKEKDDLQSKYDGAQISNVFNNSKFLKEALAVPADLIENTYRQNFKIENGKIVGYYKDGNKIFSKERAGEDANPDEALRLLLESHPQKDTILKANLGSGSGNEGGGGNLGGTKTMKRAEYDALPPQKKAELAGEMGKGNFKVTD